MLDGASGELGVTRANWFQSGLVAATALASGGILAGGFAALASSSPTHPGDVEVLNFALAFEELQASVYASALRGLKLTGDWLQFAQVVGEHEHEHVAFVRQALGSAAHPAPRLELTHHPVTLVDFQRLAAELEDLGVALYNGQAGNVTPPTLAAVAEIVSVEARHAAWARDLLGEVPAPVPSDVPADITQVRAKLTQIGVSVG